MLAALKSFPKRVRCILSRADTELTLSFCAEVGIVRLTVHQAKDLDSSKSLSGDLNPFVKLFTGSAKHPMHVTRKVKHTNNPIWEDSTEFLCTDKAASVIIAKVIDDRDFLKDPVVGYMSIRLTDLLASKQMGKDWWPLSRAKSGKIRLRAQRLLLKMAGSLHGTDVHMQYTPSKKYGSVQSGRTRVGSDRASADYVAQ